MLKKVNPVERILLRIKKISEKVLNEIKNNNLHSGNYMGKTLVDHGYIHTQTLLETLSTELSLPYIKKDQYPNSGLPVEGLSISEAFLREKIITKKPTKIHSATSICDYCFCALSVTIFFLIDHHLLFQTLVILFF